MFEKELFFDYIFEISILMNLQALRSLEFEITFLAVGLCVYAGYELNSKANKL